MSKKMEKNNITPKLFALVIAIILWINVMDEVDPEDVWEYRDVSVEYLGLDNLDSDGLVVLEPKEATVRVKVTGKRSDKNKNRFSEKNISARVDLSNASVGKNHAPIELRFINNISNVQLVDYQPRELVFSIDQIAEEYKDVAIDLQGELEEGYTLENVEVEPKKIKITGPRSYINNINQVLAKVDLGGKKESFNKSVSLDILDIDGEQIRGITKNPSMVNVAISVINKQKLPINIITEGELPSSYKITELKAIPEKVEVNMKDPNKKISSINTKPINVNDLIGKNSYEIELDIPIDVEIVNGNSKVKIEYEMEQMESLVFTYGLTDIEFRNLSENLMVNEEILTGIISIVLDDEDIKIDDIKREDINLYVDCSEIIEQGEYDLSLNIEGIESEMIKSYNPRTITLEIIKK